MMHSTIIKLKLREVCLELSPNIIPTFNVYLFLCNEPSCYTPHLLSLSRSETGHVNLSTGDVSYGYCIISEIKYISAVKLSQKNLKTPKF